MTPEGAALSGTKSLSNCMPKWQMTTNTCEAQMTTNDARRANDHQ